MLADPFGLALAEDSKLPSPEAPDHVLARWLRERLGRPPSWLEVLALRAGLRERDRRRVRWAWWRRLRRPQPPQREDLAAEFLRSWEGQLLLQWLGGSLVVLLGRLALPNPWEGFDGPPPGASRLNRREMLRERVARGGAVPMREQAAAVLAYGAWKLSGQPVLAPGCVPEAAEFLAAAHVAALNAMSASAVAEICTRLRAARCSDAGRRAALRELERVGAEAVRLWPGIQRRGPGAPLGIWPPNDDDGSSALPSPAPSPVFQSVPVSS